MSAPIATMPRMPRKRKDPDEVSRIRRQVAREAWAKLTPEERAARAARVAATVAARPRAVVLTRALQLDALQDAFGSVSMAELERLIERLQAAGVAVE